MVSWPSTSGSSTWMLSLKAGIASAAVVATAAMLLHAGPPIQRLFAAEVPRAYAALLVWLTRPYLYFVLNAIILCIAASSRFHKLSAAPAAHYPPPEMVVHPPEFMPPAEYEKEIAEDSPPTAEYVVKEEAGEEEEEVEQEFMTPRSSWSPEVPTQYPVETERPLVSVRFGHRKSLKPNPEGKALRRVARPKREETLESTWRAITEGRAVPLSRHLNKSDTWDTRAAGEDGPAPDAAAAVMRKSETFSDHGVGGGGAGSEGDSKKTSGGLGRVRLRRDPSLGQEELNRRVEAFINKFNEEMRLQRQQSLQQLLEMINRGSH